MVESVSATTSTRRVNKVAFCAVWARTWANHSSRKRRMPRTGALLPARPGKPEPTPLILSTTPSGLRAGAHRLEGPPDRYEQDGDRHRNEDRAHAPPVGQGSRHEQRHDGRQGGERGRS